VVASTSVGKTGTHMRAWQRDPGRRVIPVRADGRRRHGELLIQRGSSLAWRLPSGSDLVELGGREVTVVGEQAVTRTGARWPAAVTFSCRSSTGGFELAVAAERESVVRRALRPTGNRC